ncbi:MAG: hypothetical protein J0L61_02255 [Planctomycetes bacterium]|nr:hypothetical protein [Planctomycetota bacterium]
MNTTDTTVDRVRRALCACEQLRDAYARAKGPSGAVQWEDLDAAHELALSALEAAPTPPKPATDPLRVALADLLNAPTLDDEHGCPCCDGGGKRYTAGGRDVEPKPHDLDCPLHAAREALGWEGDKPAEAATPGEPARPLVLVNVIDGTARAEAFDLGAPSVVVLDWDAMKHGDLTPDDWTGFTDAEWDALERHASGCVEDLAERGFKRPDSPAPARDPAPPIPDAEVDEATRAKYVEAARREYEREGEIEIDDSAEVSMGDDPGAYVQAWVWVSNDEAGIEDEDNEA